MCFCRWFIIGEIEEETFEEEDFAYHLQKCGVLGFSLALALEGAKYNIHVNTIAPGAGTALTRTVMPEEVVQALKPDYVAPLVVALCSDKVPTPTGGLYEASSGWVATTRWQRSGGHRFPANVTLQPEAVLKVPCPVILKRPKLTIYQLYSKIVDFDDGRADNPKSTEDGLRLIMANMRESKI